MLVAGRGFPAKMVFTHKFCDRVKLTASNNLGGPGTFAAYAANSMFQPNISGPTHQPMFFDNVANIYDQYTVVGSKISWRITPLDIAHPAVGVAVFVDDNTIISAMNIDTIYEQNSGKMKVIAADSTDTVLTMPLKYSAKKMFGGSVIANSQLQCNRSGTPVYPPENQTYVLGLQNLDLSDTTTSNYMVDVTVEYIAYWTEIREQPQN